MDADLFGGTDIPVGDRARYSVTDTRVEEYLVASQAGMPVPPKKHEQDARELSGK